MAPGSNPSTCLHTNTRVPNPSLPCKLSPRCYLSPSRTWTSPRASVGSLGVQQRWPGSLWSSAGGGWQRLRNQVCPCISLQDVLAQPGEVCRGLEMGEEQLKHLQLTVGCVSHPAVKPQSSAQPFRAWIVPDLPAPRLQTLHKPHKSYICLSQSSVLANTVSLELSISG